jgi:gliding motility-associated-like protein
MKINRLLTAILILTCAVAYGQAPVIGPFGLRYVRLGANGTKQIKPDDVAGITSYTSATITPNTFNCSQLGQQMVTINAVNNSSSPSAVNFNTPTGVVTDASGNIYIADQGNNVIKKITPLGELITFAGSGVGGAQNGIGANSSFYGPTSITIDAAGNLYVTDSGNFMIRKITPNGIVSTVFKTSSFVSVFFMVVDLAGNVFTANGNEIKKITPNGVETNFAGNSDKGDQNGLGASAYFNFIGGIAIDGAGNLYVTDTFNRKIKKISSTGLVTTIAGSGASGNGDGNGAAATFGAPSGIVIDNGGNLYVSDTDNSNIRKITPAGIVTTIAGNGTKGNNDGVGISASFNNPIGMSIDAQGNIYVADAGSNKIRKLTPQGVVTTITPTILSSSLTFPVTVVSSPIIAPHPDLTLPADANCMATIPDYRTTAIVTPPCNNINYTISQNPVPGTQISLNTSVTVKITADDNFGGLANISFNVTATNQPIITPKAGPVNLALDANGQYVVKPTDVLNITGCGDVTSRVQLTPATLDCSMLGNQNIAVKTTTISPAAVKFNNNITGIVADAFGNVYVADAKNSAIRKITPAGVVTTLAGGFSGFSDGTGQAASFANLSFMGLDGSGNLYVVDGNWIRKITPSGVVTKLAGSEFPTNINANGAAAGFELGIGGVVADAAGNVYIADSQNKAIRKINPAEDVSTLVAFQLPVNIAIDGSGTLYSIGDQGKLYVIAPDGSFTIAASPLTSAYRIAAGMNGDLYYEGFTEHKIYKNGVVIAGSGAVGTADGVGTAATFSDITAIAVDAQDNIYVADGTLIRKITSNGTVTTIAGVAAAGYQDGTVNHATETIVQNYQVPVTVTGTAVQPTVTIVADKTTVCQSSPVKFTATPVNAGTSVSYHWLVNGANAGTNSDTFIASALNDQDKVTCKISTTGAACSGPAIAIANTITITVGKNLTPAVILGQTITNSCGVTFVASPVFAGTAPVYQWKLNGIPAGTNSDTFIDQTPTVGDVITCTVTNTTSCSANPSATQSIVISLASLPVPSVTIQATPGNLICPGSAVTFKATANNVNANATYSWLVNGATQTGATTSTFTTAALNNNDVVTCKVNNPDPCLGNQIYTYPGIKITILPVIKPIVTINASGNSVCAGTPLSFTVNASPLATPSYQWQINGNNVGTDNTTFTSTGIKNGDMVTCIVNNQSGCTPPVASTPISMIIFDLPIIILPDNITIKAGEQVTLNPIITGTIASYKWSPGVGLSSTTIANPIAKPDQITAYTLLVTNNNGCTATAMITVIVNADIIAPNTFTPNADGINDKFEIPALAAYPNCVVDIYNRYGQPVFHSVGYTQPWDGTSNGKPVPSATYYYVIDTKTDKPKTSGSITVIR